MQNEFIKTPICIHQLDFSDGPYVKNTMVFLGNVPNDVLRAAESTASSFSSKMTTRKLKENPTLKSFYGTNWKEKLGLLFNLSKIGGDDDDILDLGDELEQIDLFDVEADETPDETPDDTFYEEEKHTEAVLKPTRQKAKKQDITTTTRPEKSRTNRTITFYSNSVYPEDTISEFKEKIYIASGIHPFKQHIYFNLHNRATPLQYKVLLDGKAAVVDLTNREMKETIMGVPVDRTLYESREQIRVEAYDQFFTLDDIYKKYATNTYYMYNVDSFIQDKRLIEELKSDDYQLELLYYSFILIYWPQMTLDVFKAYVESPKDIGEIYPDLAPSNSNLRSIYEAEDDILSQKYELLADATAGYKKNPGFRDYNPEFTHKSGVGKALSVSIKNATLVVDRSRQFIKTQFGLSVSSQIKIDVRNLFDKMEITDDIPLIKVELLRGRSPFILTKTKDPNLSIGENIGAIFEQVKYQLKIASYNTILFAVRAKDRNGKPIASSQGVSKYIIVLLFDNGKYQVRSQWSEDEQMDFKKIHDILLQSTSPFIDSVNSLGRLVFASSDRLNKISPANSEFSELSMSLFWKKTLTASQFTGLLHSLTGDFNSRIIKSRESDAGTHEYLYFKGVTGYDITQIEKYISLQNHYAYLSDANVKQKWMALFEQGRVTIITHRTTDVKIEIQNIKENEFKYFYHYMIAFLFNTNVSREKAASSTTKLPLVTNTLKLLKSKDPEAFIFKKFGSDVVYSRICQKDHQPIPFSPDEIKLLSSSEQERAVKFVNYTTNNDIYYLCRKGKYPYLSFITGQHPKNYCLPCCKKTPAYSAEISTDSDSNKKDKIYSTCLETHEYVEQDEESGSSRYVMNYGKDIYIGRIGKMPDVIQQYLLYNLENVDILSEFTIARTFIMNGKKYSVDRLFKITKNIKIHKVPIADLVSHLTNKSWEYKHEGNADIAPIEVIESPKKNRKYTKHHNRILNADMQYPILVYMMEDEPDDKTTPSSAKTTSKTKSVIVDGLHRLSRAYIEKHPTINVRYVTNKQLDKVFIKDTGTESKKNPVSAVEDTPPVTVHKNKKVLRKKGSCGECKDYVEGGCPCEDFSEENTERKTGGAIDEKKPGYYLYGVPQNNRSVQNIGLLYSMAIALNMEFQEFISFTIKILRENPHYFQLLMNGELVRYFSDMKELIVLMTENFLRNSVYVGNVQFTAWNELFIDIAKICYDKTVIIFDDTSIITTGTSMKSSTVDDINLILPNQVRYLEDIIPEVTLKNYILVLQRRKKSKSAFEKHERVYYPIFIFVPYAFFKSHIIEKRVYTQHDEIMKLIKSMVSSSLEEFKEPVTELDFNILVEYMGATNHIIHTLFINAKDMCYAVILDIGASKEELVYVPIKYSYYNNAEAYYPKDMTDDDILEYGVFDRNKYVLRAKALKSFIEEYNRFVVKKSKALGMLKTIDAGITEEEKVLPVYPLLKMDNILTLSNNPGKIRGSEYVIIGLADSSKHYYVSDVKGAKIADFLNLFKTGYNVFYDDSLLYMYYDPVVINKVIAADPKEVTDRRKQLINRALYKKYLYRMFQIEFIRYFDKDRNKTMRSKIYDAVKKGGDPRERIEKLLVDYKDDAARIGEQISMFYTERNDKKLLLEDIKSSVYRFDRTTLVQIMKNSDDYWANKVVDQDKQHKAIADQLRKISKVFIKVGTPKLNKTEYLNVLTSCSDEAAGDTFCDKKRLIVPADRYDDYINLFADDLLNPLKSPYIMALIFMENVIDEFRFQKRPGEQIYIKF
jgi:hypothetical protein